jgi:hypothetical protein
MVETYLRQKALFKHLEYGSFEFYRAANYVYASIKEKKYFTRKLEILENALISEEEKENQLEDHETLFKDDFKKNR